MKWATEDELRLVLLALPSDLGLDADKIREAWPKDGEVPTVRAIKDRFTMVKKRVPGANLKMCGGALAKKNNNAATTPVTPATTIATPASKASSTATLYRVSNFRKALAAASGSSDQKSKLNQSGRKRKHLAMSDDEEDASMTDSTSEDESPSKAARRSPSIASRRSSRRSASIRPKYSFNDEEEGMDGHLEDDAAKEIDTEDEWAGSGKESKEKMAKKEPIGT